MGFHLVSLSSQLQQQWQPGKGHACWPLLTASVLQQLLQSDCNIIVLLVAPDRVHSESVGDVDQHLSRYRECIYVHAFLPLSFVCKFGRSSRTSIRFGSCAVMRFECVFVDTTHYTYPLVT